MPKKLISLFMALVFFSVLAVELHTGQINNLGKIVKQADSDSSPGFMEAEKENEKEIRKPAQKFPWLLVAGVAAGVATVAFIIFMVLKKKDFDIRGTWELTGFSQQVEKIVFFGTKKDGKYRVLGNGYGDYHVEEKNVSFGWATHSVFYFFVGFFTTPEYMEGTCKGGNSLVPNWEGTWSAKKISSKTEIE